MEPKGYCKYCNTLHKAFGDVNYCSNNGDSLDTVKTNAYYFNSNNLVSGEHISRISIRTIFNGYQEYEIDGRNYLLDSNKYFIVSEGTSFSSEIDTNEPVEGLLVAYQNKDISDFVYSISSPLEMILDVPFNTKSNVHIESASIGSMNANVWNELKMIMTSMKQDEDLEMQYQESFINLLQYALADFKSLNKRVNDLNSAKSSTKKEIYRRVSKAKEFIDCNLSQNLDLSSLSKVAMMSQFHFMRCFKKIHQTTPHQYITMKRIKKAQFLLRDGKDSLDEILNQIGLNNKSSFTRLFKKQVGMSTSDYRRLNLNF